MNSTHEHHQSKTFVRKSFPRVVAHRGFSKACPENTLPAFGAAVALGADEIELDIWPSADGEMVIIHDPSLNRTTDKTGVVKEMNWADIVSADAGIKSGEQWCGVRVPRLENVWDAFAGQLGFNIHIKDPGDDGLVIRKVKQLADKYGIADQIYVAGDHDVMQCMLQYAPEIERCCLARDSSWELVDNAIHYTCARVQLQNKFCNEEQIHKAHDAGIICNLFYADDPKQAEYYLEMGIDCILTNALAEVLPVIKNKRKM